MGGNLSQKMDPEEYLDLRITQELEKAALEQTDEINFALAGLDFAGKKTILRQLKSTFDPHYRQDNPEQFVSRIHENIIRTLKTIVIGVRRLYDHNVEQNKLTVQARLDAQKLAEQQALEEAQAEVESSEDDDEDSSSEVTEDTDEEEEARKAAEEAAAKQAAEEEAAAAAAAADAAAAAAAAEEAKKIAAAASKDDLDDSSDSDQSSEEEEEENSEDGVDALKPTTEDAEGLAKLPDLKKLDNLFRVVEMYDPEERISFEHVDVFMKLWNSWEVQETMRLRDILRIQLRCDITYFMAHLEEVVARDYEPQHAAIIRIPCAAELNAVDVREIDHVKYTMIDLSSQQNKISKWLHLLSNLNSIIFVVAIDEYDLPMDHDPTLNRITESAKLLCKLMENKELHSHKISKFLWFNKFDSFARKIKFVDIRDKATRRFLDYEGGKCVCTDSLSTMGLKCKCKVQRKAVEYLKNQFLKLVPDIRTQFRLQTCQGLDKYNIRSTFGIARDVMLKKAIYGLGDWV